MRKYPVEINQEGNKRIIEIYPKNKQGRLMMNIVTPLVAVGLVYAYFYIQNLFVFNIGIHFILLPLLYILYFFVRSTLWLNKGKEVIVITPGSIQYHLDFVIWKERKKKRPYQKLEVLFRTKGKKKEHLEIIDEALASNEAVILGFKLDGDKIINGYLPISLADAKVIARPI